MRDSTSWDPGKVQSFGKMRAVMRLIRIEHTLFSLPFAYVGIVLSGFPYSLRTFLLSTLAVFGLRTAGMSFNNIADLEIDRRNPRTVKRPLVTGALSLRDAWVVVILGSAVYFTSAMLLNIYALLLSPILYAVAMSYPYAKRMHSLPHLHLGLSLGLVVFGGAIAASGSFVNSLQTALKTVPWLYLIGVTFWVAGFDILYSIMDIDYDRKEGLGSIPAKLGAFGAIKTSSIFYAVSSLSFFLAVHEYGLGEISAASVAVSSLLMLLQVLIVRKDLSKIPTAFNLNLFIGIVVSAGTLLDVALGYF
ncbi:MAG: UbiA-like polyprenyltransferase [Fervidicoccaceae archaeon]